MWWYSFVALIVLIAIFVYCDDDDDDLDGNVASDDSGEMI